jgi:catechol 2,3-dioxygenase-like lactoylglutathione lyase family enzyme
MSIKRMHVAVNCTDLEASFKFYRAFLVALFGAIDCC